MSANVTTSLPFQAETHGLYAPATLEYSGCRDEIDEAIILAPGLGSPELSDLRHHLALLGHAAISFVQPRARITRLFGDVGEVRADMIQSVAAKAERYAGVGNFTLALHSLASFDGTRAAPRINENSKTDVVSVEYMAAAGLTGEGFFAIANRLGQSGVSELTGGYHQGVISVLRNVARNPFQIAAEGIYGSSTDLRPALEKISGIVDTGLLQFEKDKVFLPQVVDVRTAGIELRRTTSDYPRHSCHISPLHDPRRTAEVLHDVLLERDAA